MNPVFFSALVLTAFIASGAEAAPGQNVKAELQQFQSNPKAFMNKRLPKKNASGQVVTDDHRFPLDKQKGNQFVELKAKSRKEALQGRSGFGSNDDPADLVDRLAYKTLSAIERANLMEAALDETPWSDDYWAIYSGILAKRYADPSFPGVENWKKNTDYVLKNLGKASDLDMLSPAEKYDLLVGDTSFTMTKQMIAEGKSYYDSSGKVETWMGICHGWAPAAYMLPRPKKAIEVLAADGRTTLKFFPSDIKSLASLLWANVPTESRFIGGRCDVKNPKMDSNGRVLDESCLDTNPGAWHLAVVNQIGASKRSFVLDATYDMEVWNQPVYSYSYTYFNPETGDTSRTLEGAKVALSDYRKDKFAKYRDSRAKHVVGIAMEITYIVETSPSQATTDSSRNDAKRTVEYMYDLELDARGNIIGGEWYNNNHPDFLWTPPKGEEALSVGDAFLGNSTEGSRWNGTSEIPESWQKAASRASERGQPLARIVNGLIKAANSTRTTR